MVYVDSLEKAATKGTTYLDCFRGTNGRRTELACIAWVADAICGAVLGGLTVSLYSKAGISFQIQVSVRLGVSILALATTITTWFIINKIGRKSLLLGGVCAAMTTLLVAGLLGIPKNLSDTGAIVAGTLLMVLSVIGSIISPVIYTIVAEIPSTRLRIKTIALARGAYYIANAGLVATITEKQLDPETKGRTYAELSILFENNVPARKFKAAQVGPIKFSNGHGREDLAIHIANTSALEYQTRNLATMTA
ncbi:hypothetical protein NPX13_g8388 [Xylaria arbuscula]|uniref:Major facilitator superfamily (MFS) profile domain-containing protein n=1 Tax=Xylaria arbuscula TaxID=114810 RepID=A0A9W8TJW2_9PEZI|nr:hypothetical protein NPX13_g8388 [Xylaria arbuscula]